MILSFLAHKLSRSRRVQSKMSVKRCRRDSRFSVEACESKVLLSASGLHSAAVIMEPALVSHAHPLGMKLNANSQHAHPLGVKLNADSQHAHPLGVKPNKVSPYAGTIQGIKAWIIANETSFTPGSTHKGSIGIIEQYTPRIGLTSYVYTQGPNQSAHYQGRVWLPVNSFETLTPLNNSVQSLSTKYGLATTITPAPSGTWDGMPYDAETITTVSPKYGTFVISVAISYWS